MGLRLPFRLSWKLLVALLPPVFAVVGGIVWLQYNLARREMMTEIDQQIRFIAQKKAGEIDLLLDQRSRDVQTLAETPLIADYYHNVDFQLRDEAEAYRKELERYLARFAARSRVYPRVLFLDSAGRVVCRVEAAPASKVDLPAADFAQASRVAAGRWWVSPIRDLPNVGPILYYAHPVRDDIGALKGVLVLAYDLAQLVDLLRTIPLGQSGRAYIQAPEGRRLAAREGGSVAGLLVASHPLTRMPWTVVLEAPLEDFLGPLRSIRNAGLLIALLGLAILAVVLRLVVRTITRPIENLVTAARAIGAGDLSHRVTEVGGDELGALGAAFNEMAEHLDENRKETARLQSQLIQAEKLSAVGQLISAVAHELNNPLAAISGYVQMAQLDAVSARLKEDLAHMYSNVLRCRKVVDNLLFFVRQSRQERRKVDLNAAVGSALELLEYRLVKTEDVRVVKNLSAKPPEIAGDFQQIVQVLVNLIGNACDAMEGVVRYPEEKLLTIRTGVKGESAWFEIEDNGAGIPAEIREKIFQPFFTTKAAGRGTGLGLPICRQIVQAHGGVLAVESRPGRGTVFRAELPAGRVEELGGETEGPVQELAAVPGRRVLVADDEHDIAEVIARLLREDGDEVTVAHNGTEALGALARESFDLVVTDIEMEHAKGTDLYAELAAKGALPHVKVLFVTADILNPKVLEFLSRTKSEYLVKPFDIQELRQTMRRLLAAAPAARSEAPPA